MDTSVSLLENSPPVKFIRNHIGLGEHFGPFDVYGESKTTVSVAEVVDRLLEVVSRITGSSIVICVLELFDGLGARYIITITTISIYHTSE